MIHSSPIVKSRLSKYEVDENSNSPTLKYSITKDDAKSTSCSLTGEDINVTNVSSAINISVNKENENYINKSNISCSPKLSGQALSNGVILGTEMFVADETVVMSESTIGIIRKITCLSLYYLYTCR